MAIGATSIIKDANGVNITVKDIASDYLIEQADGTYHRENYRTDETMIQSGWQQNTGFTGYRKLPGGIIIQWLNTSITKNASGSTFSQDFALPVPMRVLVSEATCVTINGSPDYNYVYNTSARGVSVSGEQNYSKVRVSGIHITNNMSAETIGVDVLLIGIVV